MRIGRYVIEEVLRSDSGGQVARGHFPELHRRVLVTVLSPMVVRSDAERARLAAAFDRECRLLAGAPDPRVAKPYDRGTTEDGEPFLVFDDPAAEGLQPLPAERGAMDTAAWIALAVELGEVLILLAEAGVFVYPFRPDNIWRGADGKVRLLHLDAGRRALPVGTVSASPYEAPETADGRPLTEAAQVYSLAAWLYERLAGKLPGEAASRGSGKFEALWLLNDEVSGAVDDAVQAALRVDPYRRTPSMRRFLEALEQARFGRPPKAPPVDEDRTEVIAPPAPPERPEPGSVALYGAVALLLGVLGWLVGLGLSRLFPG